jgi:peptidyl-prolyl cis-trans isomerase SDCCAG10
VLSFGDEVEEEEDEATTSVKDKIKSIHDVLDDPRFLKGEPEDVQLVSVVIMIITCSMLYQPNFC